MVGERLWPGEQPDTDMNKVSLELHFDCFSFRERQVGGVEITHSGLIGEF